MGYPTGAGTPLSQDGSQQRGLWGAASLTLRGCPLPSELRGAFPCTGSWEGLPHLENERTVVSYLGRAQLLLVSILEFLPAGTHPSCSAWCPSVSPPSAHRQPSGQTCLLFRADPASSPPKSEATGSGEWSLQPQLRSEVDKCFRSYRMKQELHERGTCQDRGHSINVF